jgi:hypothetical protein
MADSDSTPSSVPSGDDGPVLSVDVTPPQLVVVARGFLPGHGITIRVVEADDTANYFQYTSDLSGHLTACLPSSISHGTLAISATDGQPDPTDTTGVRWTNTHTVRW